MLATHTISLPSSSSAPTNTHGVTTTAKRKRKPAGTPDPDAEVVYLSPETLMESDRYVCEVCNLSFQREQNLQMHRRRHKLPWTLHKNERPPHEAAAAARKRAYVCPEPSCVHHDPAHALGDLVGIKKHFRRKHTNHKQWVCERCSKGYAVHSDFKAHLKTCGTRGHSCDCGRVFSRVETFIEHQDSCKSRRKESGGDRLHPPLKPAAFFPPIFNLNLNTTAEPHSQYRLISERRTEATSAKELIIFPVHKDGNNLSSPSSSSPHRHTLELRELFPSKKNEEATANSAAIDDEEEDHNTLLRRALILRNETKAVMKVAMEQKAKAAEKRKQARVLMEMANQEMERAKKMREQAFVTQIRNAQLLQKDRLTWQMLIGSSSGAAQHRITTCDSCKLNRSTKAFQESAVNYYFPPAITHGENGDNNTLMLFRPP
ncbi:PREDICTED: protein indeterminate-domain 16-like [Ipomoea nil]|uniref:protein indeterminate-domain 16-like n=1 Tax=Ipomoea nil TaxID=35883 RepID=UPI0009019772|nr:PREDICTED: protein indeterminate-domain 16-like [Ipomoea nil]